VRAARPHSNEQKREAIMPAERVRLSYQNDLSLQLRMPTKGMGKNSPVCVSILPGCWL
jgi:hypothetical protein